jgi:streptogramin lyase
MKRLVIATALMTLAFAGCESNSQPTVPADAPAPAASPQAMASPSAAPSETAKISCEKGKDTRILEVIRDGAGCIVNYTKNGKTSSATRSSHGDKHCLDYQKKVREKLEHSGYKCQ